MLTRFHKILLGLLVAQLALLALVLTRGSDTGARAPQLLLPSFDAAKVTRIQVTGEGSGAGGLAPTVDLVKHGGDWVVASSFDYPADAAKVSDLLAALAKMSAAEPIATTAARHKQLRVADDDFARKLVLTIDGHDQLVRIGGPAGARHTAIRLGSDDRVYGVTGPSATLAGADAHAWVQPTYLAIPNAELAKITIEHGASKIELAREAPPATEAGSAAVAPPPPAWTAAVDGAPIDALDGTAVDKLVREASTIEVTAPADPKRDAAHPSATITIERRAAAGAAATPAPVVLDIVEDGARLWVHARDRGQAVDIEPSALDAVLHATRDALTKKPPAPPAPTPAPAPHAHP